MQLSGRGGALYMWQGSVCVLTVERPLTGTDSRCGWFVRCRWTVVGTVHERQWGQVGTGENLLLPSLV